MYTLDTNAIIYFLGNDEHAVHILRPVLQSRDVVYVSTVTELELFSYPALTAGEEQRIERLLTSVSLLALDSRVARIAGFLRRRYGLKTADSAIAATALFTGTSLLTRNTRDFRRIPDLSILPV